MTLNRSSREPGGQASNWRPPGNQNQTGNRFQNFSTTETEVNTSERLVLPSSDQQRDRNQNSQKLKRTTKTSCDRRVVTRRRLFDNVSLTTLIVLSVALLTTAQPNEGNFFSTFS